MALGQPRRKDPAPQIGRKPEQAELVGDGGLGFAQTLGDLELGDPPLVHQPADGLRLLKRVEILPLDVLDQPEQGSAAVVGAPLDAGHPRQPRQPGRAQAPLSRDQLVAAVLPAANRQGLQQAVAADAFAQSPQVFLVEDGAGLIGAGVDHPQRQGEQPTLFVQSKRQNASPRLSRLGQV